MWLPTRLWERQGNRFLPGTSRKGCITVSMSAMIGYRESGGTKEGFSILRGGFLVMEMERSKQPSLPIGPGGPVEKAQDNKWENPDAGSCWTLHLAPWEKFLSSLCFGLFINTIKACVSSPLFYEVSRFCKGVSEATMGEGLRKWGSKHCFNHRSFTNVFFTDWHLYTLEKKKISAFKNLKIW